MGTPSYIPNIYIMQRGIMNTIIIGGGAAGSYAAVFSARKGDNVKIIERNGKIGRKLGITGKGRCNITNNCDLETLMKNVTSNREFLYSCFSRYGTSDCMDFFEGLGVRLKTERGNRVFPVSDKASEIVNALNNEIKSLGVKIIPERAVEIITKDGKVQGVKTEKGFYKADKVILAAGGLSYPTTGSSGDGYKMARDLGHTVTPLKPALVPLETEKSYKESAGLNLKNITLTLVDNKSGKCLYKELGEMSFDGRGISGPLTLTASSYMERSDSGRYSVVLDLKPALDFQKLDKRILREIEGDNSHKENNPQNFQRKKSKTVYDMCRTLLPEKLIMPVLDNCQISSEKRAAEISKTERKALEQSLKSFEIKIKGFRPIEEAVITDGGVSVNEINPKTMESKLIKGLYFAGEIIDVAALTGGFNLQIAYSTAKAASAD